MKTSPLLLLLGCGVLLLAGCGESTNPTSPEQSVVATGVSQTGTDTDISPDPVVSEGDTANSSERPGSAEAQAADPSLADMNLFMSMFNGTFTKVKEAVTTYASAPELISNDITIYDLGNPKVVASNGACHTMEAEAGLTVRVYDICRENSKISSITFKEMR